jgi:recombination protein RecA
MPKAILQGEMGDATIGLQARLNSKFCMKVKGLLANHNCTLFIISQTRSNIGGYGEASTTTGGNAIKFYADVRWKVWKMNDKINELNKTTVDVIKNKLASPFGVAKFAIEWGRGIDKLGEIIDYAVEFDIIKKGGAWFTYEENKFQGTDKLKDFLEENSDILLEIERKVIANLNNETPIEEIEVVDEEILIEE